MAYTKRFYAVDYLLHGLTRRIQAITKDSCRLKSQLHAQAFTMYKRANTAITFSSNEEP